MATFVVDTFVAADGTNVISHVGETGATWVRHTSTVGNQPAIDNNRAHVGTGTGTGMVYASGSPANADYDVSCEMTQVSDGTSQTVGPAGRINLAADTCYVVRFSDSLNAYQLFKIVAGTGTQLGSNVSATITPGDVLLLRMVGSSISALVNGAVVIGPITDAAITAAGKAGLRFSAGGVSGSSSTGIHVDNFSAVDAVIPGQDLPTGLYLNPGLTTLVDLEQATTLGLYNGPISTVALAPKTTTLALYDKQTNTTVDPRNTTLLLDG